MKNNSSSSVRHDCPRVVVRLHRYGPEASVLVPLRLARDPRVSARAKVLYLYLASRCDGAKITHSIIQREIGLPKGTITSAANELEEAGYLLRVREGGGSCLCYRLFGTPIADRYRDLRDAG
jgi:DNA-binding transcriptional ArsR family regulator